MHKISTIIATVGIVVLPAVAFAGNYGMAGCGLGAVAWGPEGLQTSAATTNGTFYTQIFGITSGTSECTDGGSTSASLDQKVFLEHNLARVAQDAAAGNGEYLAAFATVLGCDASAHPEFFKMTQQEHKQLFTKDANAETVLEQVKGTAQKNDKLRTSCASI